MRIIAGDGQPGFRDALAGHEARFHKPIRLAPFGPDSVLVADIFNHAIRVVHLDGRVETLAGAPDRKGYQDGPAAQARFASPHGVALRSDGAIAVAEAENNTIRLLTPTANADGGYLVSTLAGQPGKSGMRDGPADQALFHAPHAVLWDHDGGLLVADIGNARLRRIHNGTVQTVIGPEAKMTYPMDLALDSSGAVLIADAGAHEVRRFQQGSSTSTLRLDTKLSTPHGICVGPDGTLYVADMGSNRILSFDRSGHGKRFCGTGAPGPARDELRKPAAVLVHAGWLWIADLDNHQIKAIRLE